MSFILDALKKAEADRDPEARASLALAQHDQRRNRILAYGLVVALIANAAVLLWLFYPDAEPEAEPAAGPASAGVERTAPADTADTTAPQRTRTDAPTRQMPPPPVSTPAQRQSVRAPVSASAPDPTPVSVNSLSGEQRRRFPSLAFSTHIYAEDSDLRAVVVNGVRLKEGDQLENVRLYEITEDGAVFIFENRLVSVSVLDAWN